MRIVDLSRELYHRTPSYPGQPPIIHGVWKTHEEAFEESGNVQGNSVMFFSMPDHGGTHIDAPCRHLDVPVSAESTPLDAMIGEAWVVDVTAFPVVDLSVLEKVWPKAEVKRVLFKSRNSGFWKTHGSEFVTDFTALDGNCGEWLVQRGVRLVGSDYLSIQVYKAEPTIHKILEGAGVVILEGLDLSEAMPGKYELIALPLKLVGSDGAPTRAVLRTLE